MTDSSSPDQQTLDAIAEHFVDAIRQGRSPSIDDYLDRHPDASGQLRPLLQSIAMIEGIKRDSDQGHNAAAQHQVSVTHLDDYRIVREIGRGGMGLVFEAIDQSLHRKVAIKVLPSGLVVDPRNLERFRCEAKAAARLRHPNIVSVLGIGQAGDDHYYVMDYIDGVDLRQWIASVRPAKSGAAVDVTRDGPPEGTTVSGTGSTFDSATDFELRQHAALRSEGQTANARAEAITAQAGLPTDSHSQEYFRWVARVGAMISDALSYAHAQDTYHRDIKPANLLIDHDGVVSITDFGLAKVAEQQSVTRTGDVVGTPQYMAPECFEGRFDARSETYALGLTLYELLTQQPAISASSPAAWIRAATEGVKVAPRKHCGEIPIELDTIISKALSVDPSGRYRTASDLRDDLNCFLNDLPIAARRSTLPERIARWSRREPMVASLTIAVFASLLALAAVSAVAYLRTQGALSETRVSQQAAVDALADKDQALEQADAQRARAEANLTVALAAFDEIRESVWQSGSMPDADVLGEVIDTTSNDVRPADAQILQSLLGFFDELADNNSNDLRAESAAAGRRAGDIYQRLGRLDEAERAYADALQRYQSLAAENVDDVDLVIRQAQILNERAITASRRGRIHEASNLFEQTVVMLEANDAALESPEGRFEFARAHALFASILPRTGVDLTSRRQRLPGRGPRRFGFAATVKARSDQERKAIETAIRWLTPLVDEFPDEVRYHVALGRAYREQSKVASRAGRPGDAERAIQQSINRLEQVLRSDQRSASVRYELAKTLSSSEALGLNHMLRILRADSLSQSLLEQAPDLPSYQALRAHVLETLATQRQRFGSRETAEKDFQAALTLYDKLIVSAPDFAMYRVKKSQTLESYCDFQLRIGRTSEAITSLQQAIDTLQPTAGNLGSPIVRSQLQKQRQKMLRIKGDSRGAPSG